MKKKLFLVLLAVVTTMALAVGCGSDKEEASTADSGDAKAYTIGYNNFGVGAYPLDLNQKETEYAVEAVGSTVKAANDNFTVDKRNHRR